jgi:transglutaminase-like putative cysteine protease
MNPDKPGRHYWAEIWLPDCGWFPLDFAAVGLASNDASDTRWNRWFFGWLTYRLKLAHLPIERFAPIGVRLPPRWTIVEAPCIGGVEHTMTDRVTGELVYRDRARVRWLDAPPTASV